MEPDRIGYMLLLVGLYGIVWPRAGFVLTALVGLSLMAGWLP